MIPKIIHYCWFSQDELPLQAQKCIASWKKWMPDYEIRKWTLEDFDANSVVLTKEALETRKWAFLTDYVRQYALYNCGGIYMDSDVMLYSSLCPLLDGDFVSACEYHPNKDELQRNEINKILDGNGKRIGSEMKVFGIGVQAAVLASVKGHVVPRKVMDFYTKYDLAQILEKKLTAPTSIAYNMEEFGFLYKDEEQVLPEGIHLYPSRVISNYDQKNKDSVAVHWCAGSWTRRTIVQRVKHTLNTFVLYRKIRDVLK